MASTTSYFVNGPITAEAIAQSIMNHERKTDCGAHSIFLGQVRADVIDGHTVEAIEYSAYDEMAALTISEIREEALAKFSLRCLHVTHSLGRVDTGKVSLCVFSSSAHRDAAIEATRYVVEQLKARVPIWGREILNDGTSVWKQAPNVGSVIS